MKRSIIMKSWIGQTGTINSQRGASLIEVLVTILLMTIGLAGMAGLQLTGTKLNHSASLRTQATHMAYDVADRMRANLPNINGYLTDFADVASGGQTCDGVINPFSAAADVDQWKQCLEDRLPVGRGRVSSLAAGTAYTDNCGDVHAASTRQLFVVEVTWDNSRVQNEGAQECVVVRTLVGPQ